MSPFRYPADLPITACREAVVEAIRAHQVVILAGETGSGKTTQLPKMCWEARGEQIRGRIGCTQPRRVAAMSLSRRVAEETGFTWGREIGCKVRFGDDTSRDTKIKFMTDGILLAEVQSDPLLRAYSTIIIDEAHERSLNIDFLLGHLQAILAKRRDLHLVVTSATIDTGAFSRAFGGAPIIEVSGRLYPVEIRHHAVGDFGNPDSDEDPSHIEAVANATEAALLETSDGDILIFLPTERDIRETMDLLAGRLGTGIEVLGLFGRMPAAEQQRVFNPGARRRVVVSTNVAETSVTIPRIRYVIDSGLARISRYNPRTRTKRLPVEEISQSSANQRAGRAGRVRDGVCIRLYDQENFAKRDEFTVPEIQRANLAEVILRMKAFRLGDIATFPFLDPPSPASIRAGHTLLHELGCIDETDDLTGTGRSLAHLPVDPTLGRMLVQAREEMVLPEILVIAAGLSVPDPRERPEEAKEKAHQAHRAFACPKSDFLGLLKIWQAMPGPGMSRQAMRKFCQAHYLSMVRVREWRDIWRQLCDAMDAPEWIKPWDPDRKIDEDAVHRCILAGHLGHIAKREQRNMYKAGGNRQVVIFPGSNVHERTRNDKKPTAGAVKSSQPEWIVAGEIVHTSQLFARMVAAIDPLWAVTLGAHLLKFRHGEPRWDARSGRVLCEERTMLNGLEIHHRRVDYGKVDPGGATELFIRNALMVDDTPVRHRFVGHNLRLMQKMITALSRVRGNRQYTLEEALFRFYRDRLPVVSSTHDLNAWLKVQWRTDPDCLCAGENDLADDDGMADAIAQFPDAVSLENTVLPVNYAYQPGNDADGVTVRVPVPVVGSLSSGQIQWMVPGLREEIARVLLRALPKATRKRLMPIEARAKEVAAEFDPGKNDFLPAMANFLTRRYGVAVYAADWPADCLPPHLLPRVELVDHKSTVIASSRDIAGLRQTVANNVVRTSAWDQTAKAFARHGLQSWSFGDLPDTIVVDRHGDAVTHGHPGLTLDSHGVSLMLFRSAREAEAATPAAIRKLAEAAIGKDIAWLARELKSLRPAAANPRPQPARGFADALNAMSAPAASGPNTRDLPAQAMEHILAHALGLTPLRPLTEARFRDLCARAAKELPLLAHRTRALLGEIERERQAFLASAIRYPGWEADLARLLPPDMLASTPHVWLAHLPRFLKAMKVRAERAALQPARDKERAALITPWIAAKVPAANAPEFSWLLEEYRVSVFAQELGTSVPVSPKRLEKLLAGNQPDIPARQRS